MKKLAIFLLLVTMIGMQQSFAQEEQSTEVLGSKFGLGVSLFNLSQDVFENGEGFGQQIYFTIDIKDKFRLEPTLGISFADGFEQLNVGVGIFGKKNLPKFNVLYGSRFEFLSSDALIVIAPAIGGEYYFIRNFSIGTEIQLRILQVDGDWGAYSNTSVLMRFYF